MYRRILSGIFFACIIVIALSMNLSNASASDVTVSGITYNGNDYTKLKKFLNSNSVVAGKTNGKILNPAYDENNPVTWSGVTWTDTAVKRVKSISWSKKSLAGDLDLSEATSLTSLSCESNEINKLNVSNNSALTYLACYSNGLTEIDVSGDIALEYLYCQGNQLTELDVDDNKQLLELHCDSNKLSELNVSQNTRLTYLRCYSNLLSELNVDNNIALTKLVCDTNKLIELDVSKNLALNYLACYSNQLTELNVSTNKNLAYLYCQANKLSELNVKNNTALKELHCNSNQLTELDLSENLELTYLRCYSNQISELKLDKNIALTQLACQSNKLTSLDLSNNKFLSYLACYSNQLSELDVSNNTMLTTLYCQLNKLTELDVSKNELLTELHCYSNQLTMLKTGNNEYLKTVWCYSNKLNTLDFSKSTQLDNINCLDNNLKKIILNISDKNVNISANGNGYVELLKNATFKFYTAAVPIEGNTFANWTQADTVMSTNLTYNLNANTIYYLKANFSQTVVFDSQGGSVIPEQIVDYNNTITLPAENPIKEGFEFEGWYKEASCINAWNFSTDRVTSYTVLYAKWKHTETYPTTYTVKFDTNGGSEVPDIINITSGSAITAPAEPVKPDFIFKGWYKDAVTLEAWDFDKDVVTENITLYAKWEAISPQTSVYTVKFDTNGGSEVPDIINITSGSAITAPPDPIKLDYNFAGWYKEDTLINEWNFNADIVTSNITLYAKWVAKEPTCIVIFDSNGGSKVSTIKEIKIGSFIAIPTPPTKVGFDFKGWYKDSALTKEWTFAKDVVMEDMILYAKWEKISSGGISSVSPSISQNINNAPIIINGKTELMAKYVTEKLEGKLTTRVLIDSKEVSKKIEQVGMNPLIIIPINNDSEVKVTVLDGQIVKELERKSAIIEIRTENITYNLPAAQINIDKVSKEIGRNVELKDIAVNIKISDLSLDIQNILDDKAGKDCFKVVTKPVEFTITCYNGEKKVDVSRFNRYVKRTIAIPDNTDPSEITTGIVLNSDNTISPVPTAINIINGKCYAEINSLTNSVYSVVWYKKTFNDVENHWSKDAVNDMGSRLIISGVGKETFLPNRDITRAEFTEIVVKGLGLMRTGTFKASFDDVYESAWYYNAVAIASEYGLITGYKNGKFGPNDKITREQAMTIIAKSMKLTGVNVKFSIGEIEDILKAFGDSNESSHYAKEYIAACIKTGIVSGRNGHMIAPKSNITRADTAVIVRNLLSRSGLI